MHANGSIPSHSMGHNHTQIQTHGHLQTQIQRHNMSIFQVQPILFWLIILNILFVSSHEHVKGYFEACGNWHIIVEQSADHRADNLA